MNLITNYTNTLLYWNLLHVQNSIGNWRRKQDDVPIDIQPQAIQNKISLLSAVLYCTEVSSENLVLDQLVIVPLFRFFLSLLLSC